MITNEHIEQFIEQAHRYGDAKLMLCSSGNLSWRIGEEALISGTGSWVPTLGKEKVSICNIASGTPTNGVKPSMESTFHLGILRERPDVNVVLHFQSEYATAISCMKNKPTNFNVTAEIPCHVGSEIPVIPYYRPGSPELAKAVVEAMLEHNSVLRPLNMHHQNGTIDLTYVPFDAHGYVHPDDIKNAIRPNTKFVVVTHCSNVLGTIQPLTEIGKICKRKRH